MGNVARSVVETTVSANILAQASATVTTHVLYAINNAKLAATTQNATRNAPSLVLPAPKSVPGHALIADSVKWHVQFHAIFYRARYGAQTFWAALIDVLPSAESHVPTLAIVKNVQTNRPRK